MATEARIAGAPDRLPPDGAASTWFDGFAGELEGLAEVLTVIGHADEKTIEMVDMAKAMDFLSEATRRLAHRIEKLDEAQRRSTLRPAA
ncbi:hypothetical protein [Elioraea sp.]|jgi:hypothetical protein|uniref:hypothetical protein n=1 Tax=Elioraea sp. TaxID=2185103 RepID=UPI00307E51BA